MKKTLNAFAWIIFLAPAIFVAIIWNSLATTLPMHYNLNGEVDRYGNKIELLIMVLVITAINIGVYFLLVNIHRFAPSKNATQNSDSLQKMAFGISIFISAVLCIIIYSSANSVNSINSFAGLILSAVGILFSFIGNYMHNIKPNHFAGFRLPWTLKNEDNWRKTHQLGSKLWFFGGFALAIICLLLPFKEGLIIFFSATLILIAIPTVYSYQLHKKAI